VDGRVNRNVIGYRFSLTLNCHNPLYFGENSDREIYSHGSGPFSMQYLFNPSHKPSDIDTMIILNLQMRYLDMRTQVFLFLKSVLCNHTLSCLPVKFYFPLLGQSGVLIFEKIFDALCKPFLKHQGDAHISQFFIKRDYYTSVT
jgi:hypothetical protein